MNSELSNPSVSPHNSPSLLRSHFRRDLSSRRVGALSVLATLIVLSGSTAKSQVPDRPSPTPLSPNPLNGGTESSPNIYIPGVGVEISKVIRLSRDIPVVTPFKNNPATINVIENAGRLIHLPLFLLVKNPQHPDGLPSIVAGKTKVRGGNTYSFNVMMSSPNLRAYLSKEALDAGIKADKGSNVDRLDVTDAVWMLFDKNDPTKLYGMAHTGGILGKDTFEIRVKISEDLESEFANALSNDTIVGAWRYNFGNYVVGSVRVNTKGKFNASTDCKAAFTSEQLSGKAPIFQLQKDEFTRRVSLKYFNKIEITGVTDERIMSLLQSQLENDFISQLFAIEMPKSISDLRQEYPEIDVQLAKYLEPHLRELQKTLAKDDINIVLNQDSHRTEKGAGGGFSVAGIGAKASMKKIHEYLNAVERTTGVHWEEVEGTDEFLPHSASISKLMVGDQEVETNAVKRIIAQLGVSGQYIQSNNLSMYHTTELLDSLYKDSFVSIPQAQLNELERQNRDLAARVKEQQTTISILRERIDGLTKRVESTKAELEGSIDNFRKVVSRAIEETNRTGIGLIFGEVHGEMFNSIKLKKIRTILSEAP